jgi:general secretion pathway protein G
VSSATSRTAGFTLIEILVVITVIAVLASLVSPMVFQHVGDAKTTAARAQMEIFSLALDAYRLDADRYPTSAQGLQALVEPPTTPPLPGRWRGPYLRKGVPLDPWGRPYLFESPSKREGAGETYDLSTLGRDGQPGGSGEDADITSWSGQSP